MEKHNWVKTVIHCSRHRRDSAYMSIARFRNHSAALLRAAAAWPAAVIARALVASTAAIFLVKLPMPFAVVSANGSASAT